MQYIPNHSRHLLLEVKTLPAYHQWEHVPEGQKLFWRDKAVYLRDKYPDFRDLPDRELYFKRAALYPEFGKIGSIALGILDLDVEHIQLRIKLFDQEKESELLEDLMDTLNKVNPSSVQSLIGFNLKNFDIPYVSKRIIVNSGSIPLLLYDPNRKPWSGFIFDVMDRWSFGGKSRTSLIHLAYLLGVVSEKEIETLKIKTNTLLFSPEGEESNIHLEQATDTLILTAKCYLVLMGIKNWSSMDTISV